MDDKELLELAAKAGGLELRWVDTHYGPVPNKKDDWGPNSKWNPLTDDGDALRLAVKLHMFDAGLFMHFRLLETRADPARDDYEITRRAIVRAAAEIGKQANAES